MNTDSRLTHAVASAMLSGASTAWAWFSIYGQHVATIIAIIAGLYSILAARHTVKLRILQANREKALDREHDHNERRLDREAGIERKDSDE